MLENVVLAEDLRGLARRKKRADVYKSVRHALVEEEKANGWVVVAKNKTSTRLSKPKTHSVLLEDRVWSLLYRLGCKFLSGDGGARLRSGSGESDGPTTQLDIVGIDDEIGLVIECKSSEAPQRRPKFSEELAKLAGIRDHVSRDLRDGFSTPHKRQIVLAMFTFNSILNDNDRRRAEEAKVALLNESDLEYYEGLVAHLGPAARYQFLADLVPGKTISNLEITVPAVRNKIGPYQCYSFCVSPEYLLKIAYVSHRAKGKASGVDKYQRMMRKSRLNAIREYISNDGIFPTNIVVNIPDKWLHFDRAQQDSVESPALVGWLHIRSAYRVAWVIDGQHRLFAYSGHPKAARSLLPVLAFVGLPPSEQARLFVDINAEQRKVKQNLLQELYADFHWEADDPEVRSRAILSRAIQELDSDPSSPFFGRILKADELRTEMRCISLTSVFQAMEKRGFYIGRTKHGQIVDYGPLWAGENETTVRRTVTVLCAWFGFIHDNARRAWELGSADGGGLAMNDGITVCINVLRSVLQHLEGKGHRLVTLDDNELVAIIEPFGKTLGRYFGEMSSEQMTRFRSLRGMQGQTAGTRRCQEMLRREHESFNPPGLAEFLEAERTETTKQATESIMKIEAILQKTVLEELKREFGAEENDWWFQGVPKAVRKKLDDRMNEDEGKLGRREHYFDLIDYREIIQKNWLLFQDLLSDPKGNKDARTKWIADVNEIRKSAVHASRGIHMPITPEELAFLQQREEWLVRKIAGTTDDGGGTNSQEVAERP